MEQTSINGNGQCDNASSYCGLRNSRYPDSRSMGYPFDRPSRDGVVTLQQFLTPNMVVQDVKIRFTNRTVPQFQNQSTATKRGANNWKHLQTTNRVRHIWQRYALSLRRNWNWFFFFFIYYIIKTSRVEANRVLVSFENHTFVWLKSESLLVSRKERVLGFDCIRVPSQSGFLFRNCIGVLVDYRVFLWSEVWSERMFWNAMLRIWFPSS